MVHVAQATQIHQMENLPNNFQKSLWKVHTQGMNIPTTEEDGMENK